MFLTLKNFWADIQLLRQKKFDYLGEAGKISKTRIIIRLIMQIVVTIAILSFSIKVLMSAEYPEKTREIAAGLLGTIVGYWIR